MPKVVQVRRGTTSALSSVTGAEGELFVDTDKETLTVHNNYQAGGFPLLREDLNNLAANAINPLTKITVAGGSAGQILQVNSAGNQFEYVTPTPAFDAQQVMNQNHTVSISGSSSATWHNIADYSAAPGIYLAFMSYSPTFVDSEFPNSDPDSFGLRVYAGAEKAFSSAGQESSPQGHKTGGSLMSCFTLTSTTTIKFEISTKDGRIGGDTDPGGTAGRLCTTIVKLG